MSHIQPTESHRHCVRETTKTRCELVGTIEGGGFEKMFEEIRRVYGVNGCSPTITPKRGGITR